MAVLVTGFLLPTLSSDRINEDTLQGIRLGMTLLEVEQVLGGPPWQETHSTIPPEDRRRLMLYRFLQGGSISGIHQELWLGGKEEFWLGKTCAITIVLDRNDQKVCAKRLTSFLPVEKESFVDILRRWLHLP
jgi:hypothetical protein